MVLARLYLFRLFVIGLCVFGLCGAIGGTDAPSESPTNAPISPTNAPINPTRLPSRFPSEHPTEAPTTKPTTLKPTDCPTVKPSLVPTLAPSMGPSIIPSTLPTLYPTEAPTVLPSVIPTLLPSVTPTVVPSTVPTARPTSQPSAIPSERPSSRPSSRPSRYPSARPSRQPTRQPTSQPSSQPSAQPSRQPYSRPTGRPSVQPTTQPSRQPTSRPSRQPSSHPTGQPTRQPTTQPSLNPGSFPTAQPTRQPSSHPTGQPTRQPTHSPSTQPSSHPTAQPSMQPSSQPSILPSVQPSSQPSCYPSTYPQSYPSGQPTRQPSSHPTAQPSRQPSAFPTQQPSACPTHQPTSQPSACPTRQPSVRPSHQPTRQPSRQPSRQPTSQPSRQPTHSPSTQPSSHPTAQPSVQPSSQPSILPSVQPSSQPSCYPSTYPQSYPSGQPTRQPSSHPTAQPSRQPSAFPTQQPSACPTHQPTSQPSAYPTRQPSVRPSHQPTRQPSRQPSRQPTSQPSTKPTQQPFSKPSGLPQSRPTTHPTAQPSSRPSRRPSRQPSACPSSQPSARPSRQPSARPTTQPSAHPSGQPSRQPTHRPSRQPTARPSSRPTSNPSDTPTLAPFEVPSTQPTSAPSTQPSQQPFAVPSSRPTEQPSSRPSSQPTRQPSARPSKQPSAHPSSQPSKQPINKPSSQPSSRPSSQPSVVPSSKPTRQPSVQPSRQPTTQPSSRPSSQPSSRPSRTPTDQPSSVPTCQPSLMPSSQPTTTPTTLDSTRIFACQPDMPCESDSFEECAFFSGNIMFMCQNESIPCYYNVGNFSVGPNTNLTVNGTCELIVEASLAIYLHANSTIKGPSINLTSAGDIHVNGLIASSGLGPFFGVGAPSSSLVGSFLEGQGGTYGGSGGRICNSTHYSDTTEQVGTVDVLEDLYATYSFTGPSMGSGGGKVDAGRGGGRVILSAQRHVYICTLCSVEAEGSEALSVNAGAGSGGSITILASYFQNAGELSVKGGDRLGGIGGAGGGGRISINLLHSTKSAIYFNDSSYHIHGGAALFQGPGEDYCFNGGAGTLFFRNGMQSTDRAMLLVSNANISTFAASLISDLPAQTNLLSVYQQAVLAGSNNLTVVQRTSCSGLALANPLNCSYINLRNATLISLGNSSVQVDLNGKSFSSSYNASVFILQADYINIEDSRVFGLDYLSSFEIRSKHLTVTKDSLIQFTNDLIVYTIYNANLFGRIEQKALASPAGLIDATPSYYFYSSVLMTVGKNLTINQIVVTNAGIQAGAITVLAQGSIVPPSTDVTGCLTNIKSSEFTCIDNTTYTGTLLYNNTFAIVSFTTLTLQNHTTIEASALLLCAQTMNIAINTTISASNRGCSSASGQGAGKSTTVGYGGSGGGYGGSGGNGYGDVSGGAGFFESNIMFSGAGGGCGNNCTSPTAYSKGGGIVSIVALTALTLHGVIVSNGQNGTGNNGGGAGGTVSINAMRLYGEGTMEANGGLGGSGPYPGGGGGGGYIQIYNGGSPNDYHNNMGSYTGVLQVLGGSPGSQVRRRLANSNAATGGSAGYVEMPPCPEGQGNIEGDAVICEICPVGTYKNTNTSAACSTCTDAPSHSYYTNDNWKTTQCPYNCDAGRATTACYTPVEQFIFGTLGGYGGLAGCILGFFLIFIGPLLFYRLKDKYGWFENKQMDVLGDIFKKANILDLDDAVLDKSKHKAAEIEFSFKNPVYAGKVQKGGIQDIQAAIAQTRTMKDLRRVMRMTDIDMQFHACRINLLGSNHPWKLRGGPWMLPTSRPVCLRPMLLREEYKEFAEEINAKMAWNKAGISLWVYYVFSVIAPPLSAYIMGFIRKRKTAVLLELIAHYDFKCFRCPIQRKARNSLRVSISPDSTIAFIDFLFDDSHFQTKCKPLCPIGQTRLPASFKMAGLGTYFTPFFVDTNDMILQAVPQTDVASSFIDEAWISFICELNTVLRTVQMDAIHLGILKLISFLRDGKHNSTLGGLRVEFCTFANTTQAFASDLASEEIAKENAAAAALRELENEETKDPEVNAPASSPPKGKKSKKSAASAAATAVEDRDSFVAASRANRASFTRHSVSGNLFSYLGEVLNISRPGGGNNETKTPTHRQKSTEGMEMRDASDFRKTETEKPSITVKPNTEVSMSENAASGKKSPALSNRALQRQYCYNVLKNGVSGIIFVLSAAFKFVFDLLTKSAFKPEDPNGYELSFTDMCNAIQEGKLQLGISVTHPKIQDNTYIIHDDDYQSEDESEASPSGYNFNSPYSEAMSQHSGPDDRSERFSDVTSRTSIAEEFYRSPLASTDSVNSMQNAYGSKADEMAKFYKIMLAAENTMATSPQAAGTLQSRPLFSPTNTPNSKSSFSMGPSGGAGGGGGGTLSSKASFSTNAVTAVDISNAAAAANSRPGSKRDARSRRLQSRDRMRSDSNTRGLSSPNAESKDHYVDFRSVKPSADAYVEFGVSDRKSDEKRDSGDIDSDDDDVEDQDDPDAEEDPIGESGNDASEEAEDRQMSLSRASKRSVSMASVESARSSRSPKKDPKLPSFSSKAVNKTPTKAQLSLAKPIVVKKAKRFGGRHIIAHMTNLAPSAYQHQVNTWRLNPDKDEPESFHDSVSTITLNNPAAAASSASSSAASGSVTPNVAAKARKMLLEPPSRISRGLRKSPSDANLNKNDKSSASGGTSSSRASGASAADLDRNSVGSSSSNFSKRKSYAKFEMELGVTEEDAEKDVEVLAKRSDIQYMDNMMKRKSLTTRNSITDKENADKTRENTEKNKRSSTLVTAKKGRVMGRKESVKRNSADGSGGSADAVVDVEANSPGWRLAQQPAKQIKKGFQYAYMNKLFLFYFSRFFFGSNVYPRGPSYIRRIFDVIFFILCLSDLALVSMFLVETYCVSPDITACKNHEVWYLILSVWPGAVLIAPASGLIAVLAGPSGVLARIYGLWSRLAAINNLLIIIYFVKYNSYYYNALLSFYPIIIISSSRTFQCLFVDLYIAHVERLRFTRGWDGLHTSLFKTKDNKQAIVVS